MSRSPLHPVQMIKRIYTEAVDIRIGQYRPIAQVPKEFQGMKR